MSIPRKQKASPAEGEFLFQLDPEPLEECVTAYGGIPLFLQAARSLDVPGRVNQPLQLKQRQRGLEAAAYVESFLVLNALGGECLDVFDRLREDDGLREMLGHEVPSPEAARKFLYQFHDESKRQQAQQELPAGQVSYIAEESAPLRALAQVNQEMVQEVGRRCAEQKIATVDLDSTNRRDRSTISATSLTLNLRVRGREPNGSRSRRFAWRHLARIAAFSYTYGGRRPVETFGERSAVVWCL